VLVRHLPVVTLIRVVVTGPHFNSVGTHGMISPVPFHYKAVARGHNTRGRTSPSHCGVGTRYNARHYANKVCPAVHETAVLGFIISSSICHDSVSHWLRGHIWGPPRMPPVLHGVSSALYRRMTRPFHPTVRLCSFAHGCPSHMADVAVCPNFLLITPPVYRFTHSASHCTCSKV
jgi:hypothetical protein